MQDNTPAPIRVAWQSGHIDLDRAALLQLKPAQLKKIVRTATLDVQRTEDAIRAEIETARRPMAEIHDRDPRALPPEAKREYDRLTALLAVLEPPKKQTPAERVAARLIKRAPGGWQGVFEDAGKTCVCDRYMLLAFTESLRLPAGERRLDAAKIVSKHLQDARPVAVPSLAEVKDYQRLAKCAPQGEWMGRIYPRKGRAVYYFGDGFPAVELDRLRDVVEAMPGALAYCAGTFSPLVFVSGAGFGLLTPLNLRECEPAIPYPVMPPEPVEESAARPEIISDAAETVEPAPVEPPAAAPVEPAPVEQPAPVGSAPDAAETVEIVYTPAEFLALLGLAPEPVEYTPDEFAALVAA